MSTKRCSGRGSITSVRYGWGTNRSLATLDVDQHAGTVDVADLQDKSFLEPHTAHT